MKFFKIPLFTSLYNFNCKGTKFSGDVFDKIADEASSLAKHGGNDTITVREIQTAIHLILPGELAKRAAREGQKAVAGAGLAS